MIALRSKHISHSWLHTISGIAGLLFSISAFVLPTSALSLLIWLASGFLLVTGMTAVAEAMLRIGSNESGMPEFTYGLASLALGVLTLFVTTTSFTTIIYILAAWVLSYGMYTVVYTGVMSKRTHINRTYRNAFLSNGLLSILFAFGLFVFAAVSPLILLYILGFYMALWSVFTLAEAQEHHADKETPLPPGQFVAH